MYSSMGGVCYILPSLLKLCHETRVCDPLRFQRHRFVNKNILYLYNIYIITLYNNKKKDKSRHNAHFKRHNMYK